jgi:hypothetical protein
MAIKAVKISKICNSRLLCRGLDRAGSRNCLMAQASVTFYWTGWTGQE